MEPVWKVPVIRYECADQKVMDSTEWVVSEICYRLSVNGDEVSRLPASPYMLRELAYGFLVGKGLVLLDDITALTIQDTEITVTTREPHPRPHVSSSLKDRAGKKGDSAPMIGEEPSCCVSPEVLFMAVERLYSDSLLWKKTHAVHATALFTSTGDLLHLIEDVSRHSAFDKTVGKALIDHLDLTTSFLAATCRISGDMVTRAANCGLTLLVSKSTATAAAIKKADQEGITIVGYTQTEHFVVFTHPERILLPSSRP
ncbi:MAG: formate dehydrogenase accessory sulfurtransferase FdhD [Theionarchaea archaeon]|nr:formate dehydrogenase accessory sulfurtransferase FdhD [Theionarchaea archaeon]